MKESLLIVIISLFISALIFLAAIAPTWIEIRSRGESFSEFFKEA